MASDQAAAGAAMPLHSAADTLLVLGPTVRVALQCQRLLGTASLFVALRVYLTASRLLLASWAVFLETLVASRLASWTAWNSKPARRLRRKLENELIALVFGYGQGLLLLLFWPGWWILGFIALMAWTCSG